MVELYKIIENELVFVDYGVASQTDSYTAQGYIVVNMTLTIKEERK